MNDTDIDSIKEITETPEIMIFCDVCQRKFSIESPQFRFIRICPYCGEKIYKKRY